MLWLLASCQEQELLERPVCGDSEGMVEVTFSVLMPDDALATKTFGETQVSDLPKIVASIYHGAGFLTIKQISEYMLCVIYVFSLIGVLKRIREKDSLLKDIPLIIFVGGFLFSIIWEAKARYVLPYYVLLHMYAVLGLSEVTRGIQNGIFNSKVRKK
jgi:hypothetical protein